MLRKVLIILAILGVAILSAVIISNPKPQSIKIATAGPVTGQLASLGEQMLAGAKKAVEDLNAAGGLLGQKVELLIGDDQCDPKQAVVVANKLVNDGVVFVAGHFCSSSSIPASKVYSEEAVIMISPASTNPALTNEGRSTIFRVCGRDDQQGGVIGTFLAKHFKEKRIAILHDKSAYGKGLADETRKAAQAGGMTEILFEAYTAGEKDFTSIVSRLKQERADVLFVGGYHTEAGLLLRQMREQGMDTQLVTGDALVTQEFWSITGEAGEGALFSFASDPRKRSAAAKITKEFRAKNIEPEGYILYTYAAVQAWSDAVKIAGTVEPKAVAKVLREKEFDTVIGKFRFNAKGDVNLPPYTIYKWSNGAYAEFAPES